MDNIRDHGILGILHSGSVLALELDNILQIRLEIAEIEPLQRHDGIQGFVHRAGVDDDPFQNRIIFNHPVSFLELALIVEILILRDQRNGLDRRVQVSIPLIHGIGKHSFGQICIGL